MLKLIGSGLVLAMGAGGVYYWWKHQHGDGSFDAGDARDHIDKTGMHPLDTVEE